MLHIAYRRSYLCKQFPGEIDNLPILPQHVKLTLELMKQQEILQQPVRASHCASTAFTFLTGSVPRSGLGVHKLGYILII